MNLPSRDVEVVVDRLVLDGVDQADVDAVVHAFRSHLTVLAGGDPLPVDRGTRGGEQRGRPRPPTAGGDAGAAAAAAIGRRAAAAVWRAAARDRGAVAAPAGDAGGGRHRGPRDAASSRGRTAAGGR